MPATPTATAPQTSTPTGTFPPTASPTPTDTPAGPGTYGLSGHVLYYGNARPVGGATVQLQAATPATVQTDALGQFAFTGLEAGTTSLTPVKLGGWGTAISALDAAWVLQSTVGLRVLSAQQKLAADVTGNGTVSSLDASVILQYTVGLATTFRVATICGSDWLFVPVPAAAASQTLVQPQIATGTCVPGSIGFSPLAGDAAGQDFAGIVFGDVTGNWQPPPPSQS